MNSATAAGRYVVEGRTAEAGIAEVAAHDSTIRFDRAWPATAEPSLPGPAELLASAFAACAIKNVERFAQILPFSYESARIEVELHRAEQPSRFDRIDYVLHLVTEEPAKRVDLLAKNLAKHGTVYNTLAAGCDINGRIETTLPSTADAAPTPEQSTTNESPRS